MNKNNENNKKSRIIYSVILGCVIVFSFATGCLLANINFDNYDSNDQPVVDEPSRENNSEEVPEENEEKPKVEWDEEYFTNDGDESLYKNVILSKPVVNTISTVKQVYSSADYQIENNNLSPFDLLLIQINNDNKNMVYSPLSIKYALSMLADGAVGDTANEINAILGKYNARKYINNNNMTIANAMFIRRPYKKSVNEKYTNLLKEKYNASIVYDTFEDAVKVNKWVSGKTYNLLQNFMSDDEIKPLDFILINALAIDMDWENALGIGGWYSFEFERFKRVYRSIISDGYSELNFNNQNVAAADIGAVYNKYDIIKELGEDYIRNVVSQEWDKYYSDPEHASEPRDDKNTYLDEYIKTLKEHYGYNSQTTDFDFYVDDSAKVFAKDLKEYNETRLQYIAIMPTNVSLNSYIKNMNVNSINNLINNLRGMDSNSFAEGYVNELSGSIPMFKYDYDLSLIDDLRMMGINKVFTSDAELTNVSDYAVISSAKHKATIELSNEGIKAAAVTSLGGAGDATGGFYYAFDVPVKKIDLTFNKPFLYLIRDKATGEVWFAGTVYEPCEFESYQKQYID